uniref:Uncharacterized protein n=1 Tax=Arundo donax TaxID=35708 RepID=A0A0A8Y6Q9_ARUDO
MLPPLLMRAPLPSSCMTSVFPIKPKQKQRKNTTPPLHSLPSQVHALLTAMCLGGHPAILLHYKCS